MAWSYIDNRTHSELTATECEVLHQLEKNLFHLIVPNIAKLPRRVYHYTSDRGLEGILASRGFRATYWRDLIDKHEIAWGATIVNGVMQALRWELRDETLRELLGMFYYDFLRHEVAQKYYILCFTEVGESDRHWIEYGYADTGFCLKVDTFDLRKPTVPYAMDIEPVIYDFKHQTNLVLNILLECWRSTMELVRGTSTKRQPIWLPHVMSLLTAHLHFHLSLMKTESFAWEKEWRIVIRSSKPNNERAGAKRFVHLPILTPPSTSPVLAIAAREAGSLPCLRQMIVTHGYTAPKLQVDQSKRASDSTA